MILELLLSPIFLLVNFIFSFLPDLSAIDIADYDMNAFVEILAIGFLIFPRSLFIAFVVNFIFWKNAQLVWSIVEWVYKKIPGVN